MVENGWTELKLIWYQKKAIEMILQKAKTPKIWIKDSRNHSFGLFHIILISKKWFSLLKENLTVYSLIRVVCCICHKFVFNKGICLSVVDYFIMLPHLITCHTTKQISRKFHIILDWPVLIAMKRRVIIN